LAGWLDTLGACYAASVRVTVETRMTTKHSVRKLVAKITPTNRHDETDWGVAVGRESRQASSAVHAVKLDAEEAALLRSVERGEWQSVPNLRREKRRLASCAQATTESLDKHRMNRKWHDAHPMPKRPTLKQRVK
jgi:hypothetical protein